MDLPKPFYIDWSDKSWINECCVPNGHDGHFVRCSLGGKAAALARAEAGYYPTGFQRFSEERLKEICSKAGSVSKNNNSQWWSDWTTYKFCEERPKGFHKSHAPNNVGKFTANTRWWNNGVSHKRSSVCTCNGWVEGRINNGNLGGARQRMKR